jgi:hypothetical protein
MRVVVIGSLVLGGAAMFGPWGPQLRDDVGAFGQRLTGRTEPIEGNRASAVPADAKPVDGYASPNLAIDKGPIDAWATRWTGPGEGFGGKPTSTPCESTEAEAALRIDLREPRDVKAIVVAPGLQEGAQELDAVHRPLVVDVRFLPEGRCERYPLDTATVESRLDVDAEMVQAVEIRIADVAPPKSPGRVEAIAPISEIRLED